MSGKAPGSPRHPSSRHLRPSDLNSGHWPNSTSSSPKGADSHLAHEPVYEPHVDPHSGFVCFSIAATVVLRWAKSQIADRQSLVLSERGHCQLSLSQAIPQFHVEQMLLK